MIDLGAVRQAHQQLLAAHEQMVREVLDESGQQAVQHVDRRPGFRHRTGKLRASTKASVSRYRMAIRSTAKHAAFLEHGTRPHTIVPRYRKALRFTAGGRLVFARRVRHPGTRPYRFLSSARDHAYYWAHAALESRMRRIAESF